MTDVSTTQPPPKPSRRRISLGNLSSVGSNPHSTSASICEESEDKERIEKMRRFSSACDTSVFVNSANMRKLPKSPELGARLASPRRRFVRKNSRLRCNPGAGIPLVNTSSEEEIEQGYDDDSFDRKIAASLEFAAPKRIELRKFREFHLQGLIDQPRGDAQPLLRRGTTARSTIRRHSSTSRVNDVTDSNRVNLEEIPSLSPIHPEAETSSLPASPATSTPNRSRSYSPATRHKNRNRNRRFSQLQTSAEELKLEEAASSSQEDGNQASLILPEYDSPSSGIGSLKMEDEVVRGGTMEDMVKKEELENERLKFREEINRIEKQRQIEREQFQYRIENIMREYAKLKEEREALLAEKEALAEEVKLNEVVKANEEKNEIQTKSEEQADLNESINVELSVKMTQLAIKLEEQDFTIAELKEDNRVLRSQKKRLLEYLTAEKKEQRFKHFLGIGDSSFEISSEEWLDPKDIRKKLAIAQQKLSEQLNKNNNMKNYIEGILVNVMSKHPNLLEKKD